MHNIIIRHKHALGDTVCVTALVRDIHRAFPDEYRVMVDTGWASVWLHNKNAYPADYSVKPAPIVIESEYRKGIRAAQEGTRIHFLSWYHRDFTQRTGLSVPLTEPKGQLCLSPEESAPVVSGRYWVVVAGGKLDMTTKLWRFSWYQEVVDRLRERNLRFVQAGAAHAGHIHPPLRNVLSTVGRTGERELFSLIANADGVLCGITAAMHIAAVFDKPCVVVAGGREEPWWEEYSDNWHAFGNCRSPVKVPHRFLHTIGKLHCCDSRGCWMKRTVPIEIKDETSGRGKLCKEPLRNPDQVIPTCMALISPDQVVDAVWSYYEDGTLATLSKATDPVFSLQSLPPARTPLLHVPVEMPRATFMDDPTFDHPTIGGKFTLFVLCYGNYPELARRCIDGILASVPAERVAIRVAANDCCPETIRYLAKLPLQKLYINQDNCLKYPVMREILRDGDCPITTPYFLWFDDDSYVVDPKWLSKLANTIILNHGAGCRLYGWRFSHDLSAYTRGNHRPDLWFRQAPWYTGRDFRVKNTQIQAPNGSCIDFVAGGFWALETACMLSADIPDRRLLHNGGDITIGAQVEQAGYKIMGFNAHKVHVFSSGHEPRGVSQKGLAKRFLWDGKP